MYCKFLNWLYSKNISDKILKWINPQWYSYLFSDLKWADGRFHKLQIIWCRIKGHPNGPVWYNYSGLEPDTSCKDCGDEL